MQGKKCLDSGIISLIYGRNKTLFASSHEPQHFLAYQDLRSVELGPTLLRYLEDRQLSRDEEFRLTVKPF